MIPRRVCLEGNLTRQYPASSPILNALSSTGWIIRHWRPIAIAVSVGTIFALSMTAYVLMQPLRVANQLTNIRLRMAGVHSLYTTIDGYRIHYYAGNPHGMQQGPPVVLVHGLGGYAEQWAPIMMQLVYAHRRVYALDLLGYGESSEPKDASYSIPQEASIVEDFLRQMRLRRIDLAGWSMGGWVTTQVALDLQHSGLPQIRRLVLLDSAGLRFQLAWNTNLFVPDTPAKLTALDKLLFPGPPPHLPELVKEAIYRKAHRDGWIIQRSMNSMLTGLDLEGQSLDKLKMPVLLIWGAQDHIIPLSVGEHMHRLMPQSRLDIFNGCGHLAPIQCAPKIGPRLIGFLAANPPAEGGVGNY